MYNSEDDVKIVEKTMELLKVGETIRTSLEYDSEIVIDGEFPHVIHRWSARLAAEKLAKDVYRGVDTVSYPKTTWDMFKHTNKDKWWFKHFVKKFPIMYISENLETKVVVERYAAYPDANVVVSNMLGRPRAHEIVYQYNNRYSLSKEK